MKDEDENLPAPADEGSTKSLVTKQIEADLEAFNKFQELNQKTKFDAKLIEPETTKEEIVVEDLKLVNHLGMNILLSLSSIRSMQDVSVANKQVNDFIKLRRNVLGMSLAPKIDENGDDWSKPL